METQNTDILPKSLAERLMSGDYVYRKIQVS